MKLNQYYSRSDQEYNFDVVVLSDDDFKDLKKLIKIFVYALASEEEEGESHFKATKGIFTLKIVGYLFQRDNDDESKDQVYFDARIVRDEGEDETTIINFSYDRKSLSLKKIAKTIYNQFDMAMKHYTPIIKPEQKTEDVL